MATCYLPNGDEAAAKVPCNGTAVEQGKHTACCTSTHQCTIDGMCRDPRQIPAENFYWRMGCTDKTFKDPACPKYCPDYSGGSWLVWKCEDPGKWCCNDGPIAPLDQRQHRTNTSCCSVNDLVFQASEPIIYTTAAAYIPAATRSSASFSMKTISTNFTSFSEFKRPATATSPPTISTSQPSIANISMATNPPSSTHVPAPLSSPSRLGIGLGVGLGVPLLTSMAVLLWWLRRRKTANVPDVPQPMEAVEITGQEYSEMSGQGICELMGSDCVELLADEGTKEHQLAMLCNGMTTES